MKNIKTKSLLIIILIFLMFSLTGCKFFSESKTKTTDTLIEFLNYLKEDNIEEASKLFHPDSEIFNTLNKTLISIEETNNISFKDDIIVGDCIDFEITGYNGKYKGQTCALTFNATTNGKTIKIYIFTVDNKNGYGIYDFDITK